LKLDIVKRLKPLQVFIKRLVFLFGEEDDLNFDVPAGYIVHITMILLSFLQNLDV
jgi:hypothetical protein